MLKIRGGGPWGEPSNKKKHTHMQTNSSSKIASLHFIYYAKALSMSSCNYNISDNVAHYSVISVLPFLNLHFKCAVPPTLYWTWSI